MRRGIAVAPGVAIGTAYCIHEVFVNPGRPSIRPDEVKSELQKFDEAYQKTLEEIRALQGKAFRQIGRSAAAVFEAHETILTDPVFLKRIHESIRNDHCTSQSALARLQDFYQRSLGNGSDGKFQDRMADIRDIIMRLSSHLSEALQEDTGVLQGPVIVVANELLPSQSIMMGDRSIDGIVNQTGGQTSHAAILARSRGIPAVSGVSNILKSVHNGDTIIVDGSQGVVIVNPGSETLTAYRKLEREFCNLKNRLAVNRDKPSLTACKCEIELLANINGLPDTQAAITQGADGVGLYRTEYLYLAHNDVPDEEEQFENYCQVIQSAPNKQVTIRTLDIGGDKSIPFLTRARPESNPFMGLRSIRLSFENPKLFLSQIRAIYRAASPKYCANSVVQILFPMVATFEELRKLRSFCRKAEESLRAERKPFGIPKFGMMIEVPAAALMIDQLLGAVDFVSIGSNDLIQYLMAADRDNPEVSQLCEPMAPAVLRVLESVIRTSNAAKRPITLCGEMASNPASFALLLGMGLRRFSMSPAYIPSIKELASHLHVEKAQGLLKKALKERQTKKISKMMHEQLLQIAPKLAPLLTRDA